MDSDGIQDDGEPGLPGVEVTLTGQDADGNDVELSTATDADGRYVFTDVPPGQYTVHVDAKGGTFTTPTAGDDRDTDSNVDADGNATVTVVAGVDDMSVDVGIVPVKPSPSSTQSSTPSPTVSATPSASPSGTPTASPEQTPGSTITASDTDPVLTPATITSSPAAATPPANTGGGPLAVTGPAGIGILATVALLLTAAGYALVRRRRATT